MKERKTDRVYGACIETILEQARHGAISKYSVSGMTTESASALLSQLAQQGRLRVVRPGRVGRSGFPALYRAVSYTTPRPTPSAISDSPSPISHLPNL